MDMDVIFVVGLVIAAFSLPGFVSAFSDRRFPKMPLVMALMGGGMVYFAIQQNEGAYTLETIDDVFVSVVARYII